MLCLRRVNVNIRVQFQKLTISNLNFPAHSGKGNLYKLKLGGEYGTTLASSFPEPSETYIAHVDIRTQFSFSPVV